MKRLSFFNTVVILLLVAIFIACNGGVGGNIESVTLRKTYTALDKTALLESLKSNHLYCPGENIAGELILKNRFEPVILGKDKVVNDHATNLMWQRDEDATRFTWKEIEAYVAKVNEEKFAGYNDWRLPTAEELASLITPEKNGDNFIDPVFHKELLNTWTGDEVKGMPLGAWFIDFNNGKPGDGNRAAGMGQARLVRSM